MRSAEEEEVPEEFDRPSVTISLLTPPLLLAPNGAEVGGRRRPLAGHSRSVRQKMKERALDKFPDPSSSHIPPRVSIFVGGGIEGSVALFPVSTSADQGANPDPKWRKSGDLAKKRRSKKRDRRGGGDPSCKKSCISSRKRVRILPAAIWRGVYTLHQLG